MLSSKGECRVSIPMVDDEGVDLIVSNATFDFPILLQIKSRYSLSKRQHYRTDVRKSTLSPSLRRFLLFVYFDASRSRVGDIMWLIPSMDFIKNLARQNPKRKVYVFDSSFRSRRDMWQRYQTSPEMLGDMLIKYMRAFASVEREEMNE